MRRSAGHASDVRSRWQFAQDNFADRRPLGTANMIEFEKPRIRKTAVDARVISEVLVNQQTVASAIPPISLILPGLQLGMSVIIEAPIRLLALFTPCMSPTRRSILDGKRIKRFCSIAPVAVFHDANIATSNASVLAPEDVARPEGIEPPSFRLEGGCLIR